MYFFEDVTFTHCQVPNYLPSISAAIGNYPTQRIVWSSAIALHIGPRFIVLWAYYHYYQEVLKKNKQYLALITCLLNAIENVALVGLSFITSAGNYPVHEKFFMTFMLTSELYMMMTCYLWRYARRMPPDNIETRSFKLKFILLCVNVIAFSLAGYCFVRHNIKCEAGMYTLFALFEYVVVLTNMGFHFTAILDFHGQVVIIDQFGITVR